VGVSPIRVSDDERAELVEGLAIPVYYIKTIEAAL
jgi:hypothetical protein